MLCLFVLAVVAGCTAEPPAPSPSAASFYDKLVALRAEAVEQGASPEQVSELDAAISSGEVSFETASVAAQRAVECMNSAGFVAEVKVESSASGFDVPLYVATLPTEFDQDISMALVDECDQREQYFVSLAFQTQPAAREAQSALIEERTPTLIECLEEHERDVPSEPSQDELVRAALDYMTEQFEAGVSSELVVNCLDIAGIDSA